MATNMHATRMSLELSDGLVELRHLLDDYQHEPRILDPQDARILSRCIQELTTRARALENEVSQKRWNEIAKAERLADMDSIIEAVHRPGSNIALFPVIPRPFSDGRPGAA